MSFNFRDTFLGGFGGELPALRLREAGVLPLLVDLARDGAVERGVGRLAAGARPELLGLGGGHSSNSSSCVFDGAVIIRRRGTTRRDAQVGRFGYERRMTIGLVSSVAEISSSSNSSSSSRRWMAIPEGL